MANTSPGRAGEPGQCRQVGTDLWELYCARCGRHVNSYRSRKRPSPDVCQACLAMEPDAFWNDVPHLDEELHDPHTDTPAERDAEQRCPACGAELPCLKHYALRISPPQPDAAATPPDELGPWLNLLARMALAQ